MTSPILIWFASVVGAVLFFVAGLLWPRREKAPVPATSARPKSEQADGLLPQEEPPSTPNGQTREDARRRLRSLTARAPKLRTESSKLELEQARSRAEQLDELNADLERELNSLRETNEEMTRLRVMAEEREALHLENAVLWQRTRIVDELRRENDRLSFAAAETDSLRAKLARAEEQLSELQALRLAKVRRPLLPRSEQPATSLEAAVARMSKEHGTQSTVLADDLGFPVVGYGENQEPLAAFCGLLLELDGRARSLLPLGKFKRLTLETEYGTAVSACTAEIADVTMTLATLTSGPGPETGRFEQVLGEVLGVLTNPPDKEGRS